jgi:hypothetical protein
MFIGFYVRGPCIDLSNQLVLHVLREFLPVLRFYVEVFNIHSCTYKIIVDEISQK